MVLVKNFVRRLDTGATEHRTKERATAVALPSLLARPTLLGSVKSKQGSPPSPVDVSARSRVDGLGDSRHRLQALQSRTLRQSRAAKEAGMAMTATKFCCSGTTNSSERQPMPMFKRANVPTEF